LLFGRKRPGVGPYPDTWHLIGGGIKDGESLRGAIRREIKEEAGIKVKIKKSLGFDEDYEPNKHGEKTHYIFLVFLADYVSGEAKSNGDIENLKWISKEKLSGVKLNKPAAKLLKQMGYLD
jgi:8-oxo-dGTP pyrophosphatase MutT (NUDIX family)